MTDTTGQLTLTVNHVRLPFLAPFTTSFGTEKERDGLILRMDEGGITAYGECVTSTGPFYSYEDNVTSLHMIKDHLARLLGDKPTPEEFMRRSEHLRGHNMAKAAVEMLLWDYHSKLEGRPLVQSLGPSKGHADVGISIGIDKPEVTNERVRKAIERGYKRVKVKIDRGREYQIIKSVRDSFPEIPLSADANSCYTLKDLATLKRIDRFGLVYLEQPLEHDDIIDHAVLAKEMSTPICLDESISTVDRARQALEVGACQVINIKPGRVGGLTNSLRIAKVTRKHGGHVWVGGMLETGIGRSFNVSLASQRLIDYPGDTSPNDKYFARDLVRNPFTMTRGTIRPNRGPGIGVDVDDGFLEKSTVKSWKLL